jgi:hypothetical protein
MDDGEGFAAQPGGATALFTGEQLEQLAVRIALYPLPSQTPSRTPYAQPDPSASAEGSSTWLRFE